VSKRTTEAVLRDELAKAARELESALRARDAASEKARRATIAVDERKAVVAYSIELRDRARKALEAILGRPLNDEELVAGGFRKENEEAAS
jgi:hypothetical protein